jgi:hypothetical protein
MIEQLTIENLEKYGFDKDYIEEIMKQGNYESNCTNDKGQFFVSQKEQKIYSDKEYFLKRPDVQMHFPHHNNDLFEKYYDIKLDLYLKKKRSNSGKNFNEQKNKERFKEEEIKLIESIIEEYKKQKPLVALRMSEKIDSYQNYLDWLNDLDQILQQKNDAKNIISPLTLIDTAILAHFLEIERNVTDEPGKWNDSSIRLAAFCELLYEKRYFTEKPDGKKERPVKFINDFAKSRYGIDIGGSLKKGKEAQRDHHKKRTIKGKLPLRNYFK